MRLSNWSHRERTDTQPHSPWIKCVALASVPHCRPKCPPAAPTHSLTGGHDLYELVHLTSAWGKQDSTPPSSAWDSDHIHTPGLSTAAR